ncbi:hypothetical protein [Nocardia brasiliensis]|uniref:hypothetical protein n=1 Tax=Nocardia brasiliensis TaxID=37326 RepID=UPI001895E4DC|nr:hypothetical protein [Nocardia brasiliensis]MBF6543498.1 hypothetical protein [Nocardia brasiliensis]
MGKHSAPRNTYVPARMAMLSTVTLIGMAVSANAGAGEPVPHAGGAVRDGAVAAPEPAVAVPVSRTPGDVRAQRPEIGAPAQQSSRTGRAEPGTGDTAALIESAQKLLELGGPALQEPMRVVIKALAAALSAGNAAIGPEVAKGINQLLAGVTPAPAPAGAPRHAAVDSDEVEPVDDSTYTDDDPAAETDDSTYADDGAAAEADDPTYADDGSAYEADESAYAADDSAYVTDDDAEWAPLALGPSVG